MNKAAADKRGGYRTAYAVERCGAVNPGDCVAVRYIDFVQGRHWYMITATQHGALGAYVCAMHEDQLTAFVF